MRSSLGRAQECRSRPLSGMSSPHSYERSIIERRALAVDDEIFLKCLQHLRPVEAAAIIDFFEGRADKIYNSAVLAAGGELLGIYTKANPLKEGCVAGKQSPVWRRSGQTFGINICSDFREPLLADRLAEKGATMICAPLNMMLRALTRSIGGASRRSRAFGHAQSGQAVGSCLPMSSETTATAG